MIKTWFFTTHGQRLALKRLIDISMGVITPLSEQLTKPLPNAMVLVNLKELSSGAYKLLPDGMLCILPIPVRSLDFYFIILVKFLVTSHVNELPQAHAWLYRYEVMNHTMIWISWKRLMQQCFFMIYHIQKTKSAECMLQGGITIVLYGELSNYYLDSRATFTFPHWFCQMLISDYSSIYRRMVLLSLSFITFSFQTEFTGSYCLLTWLYLKCLSSEFYCPLLLLETTWLSVLVPMREPFWWMALEMVSY